MIIFTNIQFTSAEQLPEIRRAVECESNMHELVKQEGNWPECQKLSRISIVFYLLSMLAAICAIITTCFLLSIYTTAEQVMIVIIAICTVAAALCVAGWWYRQRSDQKYKKLVSGIEQTFPKNLIENARNLDVLKHRLRILNILIDATSNGARITKARFRNEGPESYRIVIDLDIDDNRYTLDVSDAVFVSDNIPEHSFSYDCVTAVLTIRP